VCNHADCAFLAYSLLPPENGSDGVNLVQDGTQLRYKDVHQRVMGGDVGADSEQERAPGLAIAEDGVGNFYGFF